MMISLFKLYQNVKAPGCAVPSLGCSTGYVLFLCCQQLLLNHILIKFHNLLVIYI